MDRTLVLNVKRAATHRDTKENQQKTGNFVHNASLCRARFAIIVPVQSFCNITDLYSAPGGNRGRRQGVVCGRVGATLTLKHCINSNAR